jgi:hypothetical protein
MIKFLRNFFQTMAYDRLRREDMRLNKLIQTREEYNHELSRG